MTQFSKLIAILSFLAIIYSLYGMSSEQEVIVFYIGTFITSIAIFMLAIGILSMNLIHKKDLEKKRSAEPKK